MKGGSKERWRSWAGPDHTGPVPPQGFQILYKCHGKLLRHSQQGPIRTDLGFEKFILATMCRIDAAGQEGRPRDQMGGQASARKGRVLSGPGWCQWDGEKGMESPCV